MKPLGKKRDNERGAGLAEYAVLASLIAVVSLAGVTAVGVETREELCKGAFILTPLADPDLYLGRDISYGPSINKPGLGCRVEIGGGTYLGF